MSIIDLSKSIRVGVGVYRKTILDWTSENELLKVGPSAYHRVAK